MVSLFKSKNKSTIAGGSGIPQPSRNLSSRDGPANPAPSNFAAFANDDGRLGSSGAPQIAPIQPRIAPSPTPQDSKAVFGRGADADGASRGMRTVTVPQRPVDSSLYPWSNHQLQFVANANPFPRYGAASNAVSSKEGDIYIMGGLIEGSVVKGDLWIIEGGSQPIKCYPVPTTAEGPGPRVGHASLLVGNAFIVFGGDTKIDDGDVLDDTLYLLNTSTKHWSRALPAGSRPVGRYGHTMNILGSKIYVFGGQVDGFFFNDLSAFDLNALQASSSHWEMLLQNSSDGGPPNGQMPPGRTNHTMITFNDKLYLFGGTDGVHWFNDVWTYDPRVNSWAQQECIGFIPAAREGHAAALVGDVMYVFGGRTEDGKDLGDVAGFRIPTRRWYTFQNMGPSPSPRSGHGMTAFGSQILIVGGEPSAPPHNAVELSEAYILDTSKIRYPDDKNVPKAGSARRPSITERTGTPQGERSASREGSVSGSTLNGSGLRSHGSQDSMSSSQPQSQRLQEAASSSAYGPNGITPKPTRSVPSPAPTGPPPQQPKLNGVRMTVPTPPDGGRESPRMVQRVDRALGNEQTAANVEASSAPVKDQTSRDLDLTQGPQPSASAQPQQPQPTQPSEEESQNDKAVSVEPEEVPSRYGSQRSEDTQQQPTDSASRRMTETPDQAARSSGEDLIQANFKQGHYVDSGVGSSPALSQQNEGVLKELEAVRSRNAWYASELSLARKAGYRASTYESPTSSDDKMVEAFGDDEKPLLEALLRMRSELVKVQESLSSQSASAATKIAQVEKEKEAALDEAFYAKTKLASMEESRDVDSEHHDRTEDANRRLASALKAQNDLQNQIQTLSREVESERRARLVAEDSAEVAHTRASELDTDKQKNASELERLRTELHEAETRARDEATKSSEATSSLRTLQLDKDELTGRLTAAQDSTRNNTGVMSSLRDAVAASTEKATLLEQKLEEERTNHAAVQDKLSQLRAEHESRVAELESTSTRLRHAEELSESHAKEARTHRDAVLAGLNRSADNGFDNPAATDERVTVLQQSLEEANALAKRNQDAANSASERLRRAEERIAGLETYQEQISREGLGLRKQLQATSREALGLHSEKAELQQHLASSKLDLTAMQVQHNALKNLLTERGIDTSQLPRDQGPNGNSPEKFQELEEQLEASVRAHEEMRLSYEEREQEANKSWEAKLQALDNDYQSAVKYLKGTEKMLSKMKQELHRYKSANKDLEEELSREKNSSSERSNAPSDWESERGALSKEIEELQARNQQYTAQLEKQMEDLKATHAECDSLRESSMRYQRELSSIAQSRNEVESLRLHNAELEARAFEAERQVQMLLDTVDNNASNYQQQSQQPASFGSVSGAAETAAKVAAGHTGNAREAGSANTTTGDGANEADGGNYRNSIALDSLASELETLRTHWETNKSYRLSDKSDLEGPSPISTRLSAGDGPGETASSSLADWRRRLELGDIDEYEADDGGDEQQTESKAAPTATTTAAPTSTTAT